MAAKIVTGTDKQDSSTESPILAPYSIENRAQSADAFFKSRHELAAQYLCHLVQAANPTNPELR